ncbi:MAG: hypothetical protein Q8P84_08660 [Deltaproteobacteria bacterium]|nr:hypothetical protein [Deltaproteobacteria bacterium]
MMTATTSMGAASVFGTPAYLQGVALLTGEAMEIPLEALQNHYTTDVLADTMDAFAHVTHDASRFHLQDAAKQFRLALRFNAGVATLQAALWKAGSVIGSISTRTADVAAMKSLKYFLRSDTGMSNMGGLDMVREVAHIAHAKLSGAAVAVDPSLYSPGENPWEREI